MRIFKRLVLPAALSISVAASCGSESEDVSAMGSEAYVMTQFFVKDGLTTPATAEFPTDYTANYQGDSSFIVKSYVDAQNSFGANIRTKFKARIKYKGGSWDDRSNWALLGLTTY